MKRQGLEPLRLVHDAMDIVGEHLRAQRRAQPRPDPVRTLHEALAEPFHRWYRWLGTSAPGIQVQVLTLGLPAIAGMAAGSYLTLLSGVVVCYLGHLLTVAGRRLPARPETAAWRHVLEQVAGRTIEVGLVAMLALAAWRGVGDAPGLLPNQVRLPWAPALGAVAAGSLLLFHLLRHASDLHLLRASLQRQRRVPGPVQFGAAPSRGLRLTREHVLATMLLGTLLAQPGLTLVAVAGLGLLGCVATVLRFRRLVGDPEPRAGEVMAPRYELP